MDIVTEDFNVVNLNILLIDKNIYNTFKVFINNIL